MWGFLMFAGAAWLAIAWAVMRLEPADIATVAGPMILFGAVCELLRTLAGTRTWWLNAGLTVIFAATGAAVLVPDESSFTTAAALTGWYLMVRGAVDVAVGIMTRGADRVWSLVVTIGVLETGLGYFSAGPFARSTDLIVVTLGALAVLRAVADLVTSLRLREVAHTTRKDVLQLPPERSEGLTGYSAGRADFEATPVRARHRAPEGASTKKDLPSVYPAGGVGHIPGDTYHEHVVRTTADLDAMLVQAGITGPRAGAKQPDQTDLPQVPDTPEIAADAESASAGRSSRDDHPGNP
ncbi:HdeD family acid-resistance protein [Actinoplanes sp. CA-015351]|uniref:HdeD family acid-resistance protein n=1 Tax=Actinoplanes sp. CA-015351 TaxID=3239897 RepID=UPI003D99A821